MGSGTGDGREELEDVKMPTNDYDSKMGNGEELEDVKMPANDYDSQMGGGEELELEDVKMLANDDDDHIVKWVRGRRMEWRI